jgi:Ribonuclease G/E
MKRPIVTVAVLALALMLAPAAFAGDGTCDGTGGGSGGGSGDCTGTQTQTQTHKRAHNVKYSLNGTVQAVDAEASTLGVLVKQCNRRARAYKGDVVTITVTATTKLYQRTVNGELVVITLAGFKAGDRITSVGKLDKTDAANPVFTAARITLRPAVGTGPDCAD